MKKKGANKMFKMLIKNELKELLIHRHPRKYLSVLNNLRNIGNPNLAITDMYGYCIDDDIAIISKYCFDGYQLYFEISDFNNVALFFNEVKNTMNESKEILLSSDSMDVFHNPEFKKVFGEHDIILSEQYGMFDLSKVCDIDNSMRCLTIEDKDLILSFPEPYRKYHNNLRNTYETQIKTQNPNYKVYAYINDETKILGYLIANTFDFQYWDINYIFVSEDARGKGIAKKLASYYANDITKCGHFASYGTPENEISKKVAISSGFEMFEKQYLTQWVSNK